MPSTAAKSSQCERRARRGGTIGPIVQAMSTTRMTRMKSAIAAQRPAGCASDRARAAGGTAARTGRRARSTLIGAHGPCSRCEVPGNLLGQVARPDDDQLRHVEVRPQHARRRTSACRGRGTGRAARPRTSAATSTSAARTRIVNASVDSPWPPSIRMPKIVDVPVRLERHHPVHRHERDREHVEHEARARQHAEPAVLRARQARRGLRPARVDHRFRKNDEAAPDDEEEHRADEKKVVVQVRAFSWMTRDRPRPPAAPTSRAPAG